ncbi:hypothetical protein HY032_00350 [Candidatus Gottesmanbacteria bacterium]|nr:hypothetical protein [Candidatus Gottesmanbacteria bacterium]
MPTIQELDVSKRDLPRHPKGGGAVRDAVLGSDGLLHGPTYCDGGNWSVVGVPLPFGDPSTRSVTLACGLCQAHLCVDVAPPEQPPPNEMHQD